MRQSSVRLGKHWSGGITGTQQGDLGARRGDIGAPEMGRIWDNSLTPPLPEGPVGGWERETGSSEVHLQQVPQAALALLVNEVLALGECGAAKLWAGHRLALGHRHLPAVQLQLSVLGRICSAHQGSPVLGLTSKSYPYVPHCCHRECLLIPNLPTSKPRHRLGLLPGLSCPISLTGKHLLILQCLVNDTSSLKPSWMTRNDLVNDCSEEAYFFLCLSTAPSRLTSPLKASWSPILAHLYPQACLASWHSPGSVRPRAMTLSKPGGGCFKLGSSMVMWCSLPSATSPRNM